MTTVADISSAVAANLNMTKALAKAVTDEVLSQIADNAIAGKDLSVIGFGQFKVKQIAAREGRNPATGAPISIPASRKLAFWPAAALKNAMNN